MRLFRFQPISDHLVWKRPPGDYLVGFAALNRVHHRVRDLPADGDKLGWVGLALILLKFVLPFLLFLSRDLKRSRRLMVFISSLVLFMRYVDLYWSIKPGVFRTGTRITVPNPVLPVAVGGIWLWVYLFYLRQYPVSPANARHLEGALTHGR